MFTHRLISLLLLSLIFAALAPSIPLSGADIVPAGSSKVGQSPLTASQAANASLAGAYFDHVVVIIMENQGIYNICGTNPGGSPSCNGANTPYLDSLANNNTLALNYTSVFTPLTSAPNYVALISGSTFNCKSGGCGGSGAIVHSDLVDGLETAGLSWKAYFENYPQVSGCFQSAPAPYNGVHNPYIWFSDIYNNQTRCGRLVNANPSSCTTTDCVLTNDLNGANSPNFAWLTPNDCDDMHGSGACTNRCLSTNLDNVTDCEKDGDAYLKTLVPRILNSTTFRTQRSALFITFDEGTGFCLPNHKQNGDCIYAVWSGPVAKSNGFTSYNRYNHYSFLKTLEFNWNLPSLQTNDTTASAMKEFFSPTFPLSASPTSLTVSAGSNVTSTVTLSSLSGFNGTVTLTAEANPSGPSLTLNPTTVILKNQQTNSSVFSFSSALIGNYTVTLTGVSGILSRIAILKVRVIDFRISATVTSVVSPVGSNASSTITLASLNGYSGNINLTVTVQDASILVGTGGSGGGRAPLEMVPPSTSASLTLPNASLSPTSLLLASRGSAQSSLTIILSLSVQAGNYPIIVNATDGKLSHAIQLTIMATDFSLSSPTSSIVMTPGGNSSLSLSFQSLNGFQGSLSLSATVSPSGPLTTLSPSSVLLSTNNNSSLLTIIVPSSTSSGNYILSIQAASGNLIHAISINIIVSTGSVGGLIIPIDKLGLVIQLVPTGTSILILLASGLATVGTTRKRGKRRTPSHNLRRSERVRDWRCSTVFARSTTIWPFWKPATQSER